MKTHEIVVARIKFYIQKNGEFPKKIKVGIKEYSDLLFLIPQDEFSSKYAESLTFLGIPVEYVKTASGVHVQ